jgi:hypothetical protein
MSLFVLNHALQFSPRSTPHEFSLSQMIVIERSVCTAVVAQNKRRRKFRRPSTERHLKLLKRNQNVIYNMPSSPTKARAEFTMRGPLNVFTMPFFNE